MADQQWRREQRARDVALAKGEEIARLNGFVTGPVDPFRVIESEGGIIHAEGDDFRDSFDGRLSYHDGCFLLIFNTCYNRWPRNSNHHPKIRFTIAHELGHYYLDEHREFLVTRQEPIESFVEFDSSKQVEREADAFATGLLMPNYLLGECVNCEPEATLDVIKMTARDFDVSLTSMMVRWTQLSHFPCATLCIRGGLIQWGFASDVFRRYGLWKTKRSVAPSSVDASKFLGFDTSYSKFREGTGWGRAQQWLDGECEPIDVQEFYVVIPYSGCAMVFVIADESELPSRWYDDD